MTKEEFAARTDEIKTKLFKTAMVYLKNEHDALEAVDEAVYRGLCAVRKLRQPEYFDTWLTRILINECYKTLRHRKGEELTSAMPELSGDDFDRLPLRDAVDALSKELKDIIVLRFFGGYTLAETARILGLPQGTAATRQRKALSILRLALDDDAGDSDGAGEKEAKNGLQR